MRSSELRSCNGPKVPGDLSKGLFRDEKPWFLEKTVPIDYDLAEDLDQPQEKDSGT